MTTLRPDPANLWKVFGVSEEANLDEFLDAAEKWLVTRRFKNRGTMLAAYSLGISLRRLYKILDKHELW